MKDNLAESVGGKTPVLIDFYADWCGPCITLEPILEEVQKELGDKFKLLRIDVDKNKALAVGFKVKSVPTLFLYKDGEQVWRQSGLVSKRELMEVIHRFDNH